MANLKATLILSTTNSEDNITFENEDILSFSTRNRTTSDPNVPIYNSFATDGILVVVDKDLGLYEKALNGVFDKYKYKFEFELDGRRIATHTIRERPVYNYSDKSISFTLGSKLDILDNLSYKGYVLPREANLIIKKTAKDLMDDLLLSAFGIKQGDEEYDNLMTEEFSDIFSDIVIPISYMPSKSYREAFQNVLTLAKCALTVNEYDNLRFVRKNMYYNDVNISTTILPEHINSPFSPTIIVGNKYDDCAVVGSKIGRSVENAEMSVQNYSAKEINALDKYNGEYSQLVPQDAISYDIYLKLSEDTTDAQKKELRDLGFSQSSDINYYDYWGKYENSQFEGFIQTEDITNWTSENEAGGARYFFGAIGAKVGFLEDDFDYESTQRKTALCGISLYVRRQLYKLPKIEISRLANDNLSFLYETVALNPDNISFVFTKKTTINEGTFTLYAPSGDDISINTGNSSFYWKRFQVGNDPEKGIIGGVFSGGSEKPADPEEISGVISMSEVFENELTDIGFVGKDTIGENVAYYGLPTYGADAIKMKLGFEASDTNSPRVVSSWIENKTIDKTNLSGAIAALGYKYEVYKISKTLDGDISETSTTDSTMKFWDGTQSFNGITLVKRGGIPCTRTTIEYIPTEVHLTINGRVTTITLDEKELTLLNNPENEATVNTYGNLLQYESYDNSAIKNEIENIVDYYESGIHTAKVEVLGANKYIMSDESEIERPFKNGDVLDIRDFNGKDSIMYYPSSKTPIKWQVTQNEFSFDGGVAYQNLELQELPLLYTEGLEFGEIPIPGTVDTYYGVTGYKEDSPSSVKIPKKFDNKTVTAIARNAFGGKTWITSVYMPDTILQLLGVSITVPNKDPLIFGCFQGCTGLKNIVLSKSLSVIDARCFYGCSSLENIKIPVSVSGINSLAFGNCTSLKIIEFEGTMAQWNAIRKADDWKSGSSITSIKCLDGTITL